MHDELTRTEKRKQHTSRLIINTAIDLFAENGIENVSLEEIALKADIARATLYNHFLNKDDLIHTILKPVFSEGTIRINGILSEPDGITIEKILGMCLDMWKNNRNSLRLSYKLKREQMGELAPVFSDFLSGFIRLFEKSKESGRFRFISPQLTAYVMYRTFVPLLESIEFLPGYENLFIESFRGFLLKQG